MVHCTTCKKVNNEQHNNKTVYDIEHDTHINLTRTFGEIDAHNFNVGQAHILKKEVSPLDYSTRLAFFFNDDYKYGMYSIGSGMPYIVIGYIH